MIFQSQHIYICDFHKGRIQCARTKRRRKDSEDDSNETDTDLPEVDLYQLQVNTLRRYKKHYKVSTRPGMNKAQLADVSKLSILINTRLPECKPVAFCIFIIYCMLLYELSTCKLLWWICVPLDRNNWHQLLHREI